MVHLVASYEPTPGRHVTAMRWSTERLADVAAAGGDLGEFVQVLEHGQVRPGTIAWDGADSS
jgi:hypothetical protein